jgi:hypothetical protein
MQGEGTTILKYHNKPTKHAELQTNTSEGFTSHFSFTLTSPFPSPFRTKIISFRALLHRVKEKVNISVGEVFTRIYLPISYLHRILIQIQNTTTFTRITLLINRLPPKGEEVNTKNRKHLTRTRARKTGRKEENKGGFERKSATLIQKSYNKKIPRNM